jgi:Response regulators consisting of a CheY-like receiver domain and a winged-helix DNA-binding domain
MNGKIFIIEDEPSIIQLVQHNLEKKGFIVSSSLNGNDGLKELKKFQPDLLLLDWKSLISLVLKFVKILEKIR